MIDSKKQSEYINFVVDIETMGHIVGSAITEIAVLAFYGNSFDLASASKFHRVVDLESCMDAGLGVTGSTIKWWMKQSKNAQALYSESAVPIQSALIDLHTWCRDKIEEIPFDNDSPAPEWPYRVWSHATFDFPMIEAAYSKCKLTSPWAYWSAKDVRTVMDLAFGPPDSYPHIPFIGVRHRAMDDAIHEAEQVSAALTKLEKV